MQNSSYSRIPWIDVLRGIAILLMIPANLSLLWSQEHPLWFRILASYAAPIFIMLSTGMVILTANKYNFRHFFQRSLIILGFAALMDVCIWKIFPFVTFDVLYLIAFALPAIYVVRQCSILKIFLLGTILFLATPLLQSFIGYHQAISEISLTHAYWPGISRLLQSWLIDGWFPIFPWLGLALFGALFFQILFIKPHYQITKPMLYFGGLLLLFGFALLFLPTNYFNNIVNHGIMLDREGFSEIFYPPTLAYLITALGMVVVLTRLAQWLVRFSISNTLALFGRFSLFIYLFHQAFAVYIIKPLLKSNGEESITSGLLFIQYIIATIVSAYLVCILIEKLKKIYKPSSIPIIMLIGK